MFDTTKVVLSLGLGCTFAKKRDLSLIPLHRLYNLPYTNTNTDFIINGSDNRNVRVTECWKFIRSMAFGRRQGPKKGVCVAVRAKFFSLSKGPLLIFFVFSIATAVCNTALPLPLV